MKIHGCKKIPSSNIKNIEVISLKYMINYITSIMFDVQPDNNYWN